ncbi:MULTISPECIES: hypothetical protein [unclassified Salipiger]|uniref:hypothetical protein n=1 Tax=Alphaproteobacteria TaxID=28211 RepID=UPI0013B66409|nr:MULTISPECIES: hypothetical protein [unclassified Salipiger]NDV53635.1 hypothetical protein [Salipiger sp. PrR003]NDW34932.1 hypothetical protein [Salipiger sp. PrR007]
MSAKDPFQILADELTLIRKDMDQLQRTSLDKKDAQALHQKLAEGVDRMHRAASEVHQAIDNRLVTVAAYLKEEATKAAEKAARDAILKAHDESIDAARNLTQAAGEARREAWRYFGGFWVWLVSMLAVGAVLGLLLAYGMETAKSALSVNDLVSYNCGRSWFGGQVVEQDNGSSFCAFWITE